MNTYYLLANGQPNDRAIYYTGTYTGNGSEFWGHVNEAYRFNNLSEVFERIEKEGCIASQIIVEVAECTWNIIQKGADDYWHNRPSTDKEVFLRFNTVSYITNSRKA